MFTTLLLSFALQTVSTLDSSAHPDNVQGVFLQREVLPVQELAGGQTQMQYQQTDTGAYCSLDVVYVRYAAIWVGDEILFVWEDENGQDHPYAYDPETDQWYILVFPIGGGPPERFPVDGPPATVYEMPTGDEVVIIWEYNNF